MTARSFIADRRALAGVATTVVLLNVVGWSALFLVVAPRQYDMGDAGVFGVGLGVTAFLLGVRHAFDADHIAAIDNSTRKLVGEGKPASTAGFWFSLGHSSVVFGLSLLIAFGVEALSGPVKDPGSSLQQGLGTFGSLVAGTFLIVIGLMNLSALAGILHVRRHLKAGTFNEAELEHHLHQRGFLARIFAKAMRRVDRPIHLYPIGLLMGLGFDTATQVALLVLAGGTAAYALPWYAVLVLPILFAAGMTLFDSIDGAFMARAYRGASLDPGRKVAYNLVVTTLSVVAALTIGLIVLLQLGAEQGVPLLAWAGKVDLQYVGFGMAALFTTVWVASLAAFRVKEPSADL